MRTLLPLLLLLAGPLPIWAQPSGAIQGNIVWGGANIPVMKPLPIPPAAGGGCPAVVLDEEYVVHPKNKGLQWTYVFLAPVKKGDKMPIHPAVAKIPADKMDVVIDQPNCKFEPHALALREGQILLIKNGSAINHNLRATGNPANLNINPLIPAGGAVPIAGFKADRLPWMLECNIHPWMRGMMMVFDHPYFAVTEADGKFEIKDIVPGEYKLMVRHSNGYWLGGAKGKDGKTITIKAGDNAQGNIDFPPPG